ncbi:MAG: hypothetical protein WB998_12400 [Solirubrobacteraceae bacterium]
MKTKSTIATATRIATGLLVLATTLLALAATALATEPTTPLTSALPDNRQYELVTPSVEGEPYAPTTHVPPTGHEAFTTSLLFRSSFDGDSLAYAGEPGRTTGTGEIGPGLGNQWLSHRTATGWVAEDITPANNKSAVYQAFTSDLTTAFYEGNTTPLTSGIELGCASLYTRDDLTASFQPLFTGGTTPKQCGRPLFAGASDGNGTVLIQSEASLAPFSEEVTEFPEGHEEHGRFPGEGCLFACNLYAWSEGRLVTVNVLGGAPVPSATFGGYGLENEAPDFSNDISADGSRIFWTDIVGGISMRHLFVLEDGTTNVPVSGVEPAEFWTASPDGHYAYYTEDGRLWRFDTTTNTSSPLTVEGAEVRGVLGINQTGEDGAYVYFVAGDALSTEPNTRGETATAGGFNLYVLHGGTTSFIAGLSASDDQLLVKSENTEGLAGGDWRSGLGERTSQVTPDGMHVAFQSVRALTGYDSGFENLPEVYVFSISNDELDCASCNPTGAQFVSENGAEGFETAVPISAGAQTYTERWLSQDGNRAFFDSPQSLVADDQNQVDDVYEWERPSTPGEMDNTCTAKNASPFTGGCTFLLSGANNEFGSLLIDADATGNNVFFEHAGRLGQLQTPIDENEIYDARVGGGFRQTSLACTGTGCQGVPPAPPIFATPASVTFSGIGNFSSGGPTKVVVRSLTRGQKLAKALKTCGKYRKGRRRGCEARARKKYGLVKARRSASKTGRTSDNRGARS